ncbi:MAG: DUF1553 domain-containing protein, partial [Planctomycetales bacterium]|nr:DUF1553 domain-containing protein [Planctomycetales bacterium]
RYLADPRPDALERNVDRLLASPAFGERWARRWLDVAGYADSDGYVSTDPVRPWAYRYRDWVIDAFDADLPFDEFLVTQLAGDELDPSADATQSATRAAQLAATGFLRNAPDGTAGGSDDPLQAKHDVVAETIKTVSTGLLGLTVGCARCHDHRYDPISQRDYFAFASIFEPAFDLEQWRAPGGRLVNLWTTEDHARAAAVDQRVAEIEGEYNRDLDALVEEIFEKKLAELPEELRASARAARETPAAERDETQQALLREYPNLNVDRGSATLYEPARVKELNDRKTTQQAEARADRPPESFVACLTEVPGRAPNAALLFRGEAKQPRDPVDPADLSLWGDRREPIALDDPQLPTSGRRLSWARSLVSGRHPLVGRVWVNRVWAHYFGEGIVRSLGDFGTLGQAPTHPELLDQLALDLAERDWLGKLLHRRLVLSAAYRQSVLRRTELEEIDPENRLLGRMTLKRLESEMLRDAMLASTGELFGRRFGPSISVTQNEIGQIILGSGARDGNGIVVGNEEALGAERFRRSIYVQVRRSMPLAVLEPFDPPTLDPNCPRRDISTQPGQSLLLMNGRFAVERSRALSDSLYQAFPADRRERVMRAWQVVVGAPISPEELEHAVEFLDAQEAVFGASTSDDSLGRSADRMALDSLCQSLFASNHFLYY